MSNVNFIQVVEDLREDRVGYTASATVYALIGQKSNTLYGIKIVYDPLVQEKTRTIWFSDLDRMKQILEKM